MFALRVTEYIQWTERGVNIRGENEVSTRTSTESWTEERVQYG